MHGKLKKRQKEEETNMKTKTETKRTKMASDPVLERAALGGVDTDPLRSLQEDVRLWLAAPRRQISCYYNELVGAQLQ